MLVFLFCYGLTVYYKKLGNGVSKSRWYTNIRKPGVITHIFNPSI